MSHVLAKPALSGVFIGDDEARAAFMADRRRAVWRRRIVPLVTVVALLILWELAVKLFGIRPFVAPAPSSVLSVLWNRFGLLMWNLQPTAIETMLGFFLGNAIAILLAVLFVYRPMIETAFFPIAVMMNAVPIVAMAPILVLLLGNGLPPKVAIVAIVCFFPTLVNMARGLRAVHPQHLELMRILSASELEIFLKVRVKSALPYLFVALKIAASTSVVGAIVGEWIGSTRGIGALILQATYNFDTALLYATITVGSIFSALFFVLISGLERHFLKWSVGHAS